MGVGLGISGAWLPFSAYDYLLLFCGAIFFGLAVYFVALAFRGGEISVVAPFRYTSLLWAGIAGYVAFNEIPDAWSLAGAALIVASGLYVLRRDSVRSRKFGGVARLIVTKMAGARGNRQRWRRGEDFRSRRCSRSNAKMAGTKSRPSDATRRKCAAERR